MRLGIYEINTYRATDADSELLSSYFQRNSICYAVRRSGVRHNPVQFRKKSIGKGVSVGIAFVETLEYSSRDARIEDRPSGSGPHRAITRTCANVPGGKWTPAYTVRISQRIGANLDRKRVCSVGDPRGRDVRR